MNRANKKELKVSYMENLEERPIKKERATISLPFLKGHEIPWDAVSKRKQSVVKKYLFERKDFLTIAKQENLNNQARCKYEYYSALTKMSEYAIMRRFIKSKGNRITPTQLDLMKLVYMENKNLAQSAKEMNITRQAAQQRLGRVIKKYDIKWHRFVKKHKNKVLYNIPEVLR